MSYLATPSNLNRRWKSGGGIGFGCYSDLVAHPMSLTPTLKKALTIGRNRIPPNLGAFKPFPGNYTQIAIIKKCETGFSAIWKMVWKYKCLYLDLEPSPIL